MNLLKFQRLFNIPGNIYQAFSKLKKNGLLNKIHYNIEYGLHQRHITLTAEGMAMTYHIIKQSRCKINAKN